MNRPWIALFFAAMALLTAGAVPARADPGWPKSPDYESPAGLSTSLVITDRNGKPHPIYEESYAILILESHYQTPTAFPSVPEAADKAEVLLRDGLERRGFHVLIWRDLSGSQLRAVLEKSFGTLGHKPRSRLFFYYFGHGLRIDAISYLVPVDSPDPFVWENLQRFYDTALPIRRLRGYADESAEVRHMFLAFEACQAGSVVTPELGSRGGPNPQGYLLTKDILNPIRQLLTAGNFIQRIPADNSFTSLLAAALSKADFNNDGYVTGSELTLFVKQEMPKFHEIYRLAPESGSIPEDSGGDFRSG